MLSAFINYNGKTNTVYLGVTGLVAGCFKESVVTAIDTNIPFIQQIDYFFSNFNKILIDDQKCK